MKNVEDIKVKQFAIAVKKNTLKRGINLKTESLQERDDEKADARGNPQRYAMSQISNRSKNAAVRGMQAVAFSERRAKTLKRAKTAEFHTEGSIKERDEKDFYATFDGSEYWETTQHHNNLSVYRKPLSVSYENAKPTSENITRHNMTLVKKNIQPKKGRDRRKTASRHKPKRRKGDVKPIYIVSLGILLVAIIVILMMSLTAGAYGADVSDLELTGEGSTDMVMVSASQIGNEGGELYWRWYGFSAHVNWCAVFVSWCADQAGLLDDGSMPKFAVCDDGIRWFVEKGRWFNRNIEPKPGMIIFFDWDGDGRSDHVGIVEKCEDGLIHTIEGNSNDVCMKKWYTVGDKVIMGYGLSFE
ncbi:MAG: CHAP domain-containing protein [Candidatus Fimisoma sp.]|nr:CHAP domain-containing protein [Candidatus Fimisoma sp.]